MSDALARGRTAQFLLLTVVATAALYARTAVNPLQETMRIALDLSDNQMAWLQGPALALAPVTVAVLIGLLVDRYSRVRLLLVFALCNLLGTVLTALAASFVALFAARCLIGLAHTGTSVAAFSLLADLYRPEERGRASMVVLIGQIAGMGAVFALGGALVSMSASEPGGWRWAMMWLAAPLAPVLLMIFAMNEPARTGVVTRTPAVRAAFSDLWRRRSAIAPLLAALVMTEVAVIAVLVWAAPMLSRSFSLPPEKVGGIMSLVIMIAGVVGSLAGGFLADRCQRIGGPPRTMWVLSALAFLSAPSALFAIVSSLELASVLLVTFLLVVNAAIVIAMALLTIIVPSELRGLSLSIAIAANTLFGVALTPLLVSGLSGAMGGGDTIGTALAIVCVAAALLATLLFAVGSRTVPRVVAP